MRWFWLLCLAAAAARAAETPDFARYQPIIERSPFGTVGPIGAAAPAGFAARFAFVGVVTTVDTNQVLAMIQDKQTNRTYFKAVGEMIDSVKVLQIHERPAKLVLQQGVEQATLAYEARAATPPPPGAGPGGAVQQPLPNGQPPMPLPSVPRRIPFRRGG